MKYKNSIAFFLFLFLIVPIAFYSAGCGDSSSSSSAGNLSGIYKSNIENFKEKGDVKLWVSFHKDGDNILGGTRIIPEHGGSFDQRKDKDGHEPVTAIEGISGWSLEWSTIFGVDIGTISFEGTLSFDGTTLTYSYTTGSYSGSGIATRVGDYVTGSEAGNASNEAESVAVNSRVKSSLSRLNVTYDADNENHWCPTYDYTTGGTKYINTGALAGGSFVFIVTSFTYDGYGGYDLTVDPTTDLPRLDCSGGCSDLGSDLWAGSLDAQYGSSQDYSWLVQCNNFSTDSGCSQGSIYSSYADYYIYGYNATCGTTTLNNNSLQITTN